MFEFIPPATRFVELPSPFTMKRGGLLHGARMAYETWGELDANAGNAILIHTGLSPNAHAASHGDNPEPGWWEAIIGPGRPIDTRHWFVICINTLGSCKGSTGPASLNPATGEPWRLDFPALSIEDCADAAAWVVKALGIERLALVIGNSMGGMTALSMLARHPGLAANLLDICGAARALPFSIAIRSLQREAIRLDPDWNSGHYDQQHYPRSGMRIARKLGVITYRSAMEWKGRFGRVRLNTDDRQPADPFAAEFQVESYLEHHAQRFIHYFDPNSYLYLGRAMDWFDLGECASNACGDRHADTLRALATLQLERACIIGVETDLLFPLEQQQEIAEGLRHGGTDVTLHAMPSPEGHDAFLVDIDRFGPVIANFLASLSSPAR